jgi:hypothetical protein
MTSSTASSVVTNRDRDLIKKVGFCFGQKLIRKAEVEKRDDQKVRQAGMRKTCARRMKEV